jgi:hypothetical protein
MATPQPEQQTPSPAPQLTSEQLAELREQERKQKMMTASIIAGVVFILVLLGAAIFFLMQPVTPTDKIRDVFIIVVALESLVIGVALIVLIVQLASLINLLQNEVRPILNATNETVNTLRGTVEFLGEEVIEPVMKLSGYLAGITRMLELMGIKKK